MRPERVRIEAWQSPSHPTSADGTARGFGEAEVRRVGELILGVVDALAAAGPEGDAAVERAVLAEMPEPCRRFPIYR